jgi:hypothetical protein
MTYLKITIIKLNLGIIFSLGTIRRMYFYLIVAILILFMMMQNRSRGTKSSIEKMVKQAAQYAITAQQDVSPVMSVRHANYAVAHLYALGNIATDTQIHNATGIDVKKFREHITNVQEMTTKKTVDKFPDFAGQVDMYLSEIV